MCGVTASHYTDEPLGRYAYHSASDGERRTVQLLGLPIGLFLRAREHHDDLMREFALLAIQENEQGREPLPPRLHELVDVLGRRFGASASRRDAVRDAAIERHEPTVDLAYQVPPSAAADIALLDELMDSADEFCRNEQLLTLPRDSSMVAFARWYNGEFLRQLAGEPPRRWDGPLD